MAPLDHFLVAVASDALLLLAVPANPENHTIASAVSRCSVGRFAESKLDVKGPSLDKLSPCQSGTSWTVQTAYTKHYIIKTTLTTTKPYAKHTCLPLQLQPSPVTAIMANIICICGQHLGRSALVAADDVRRHVAEMLTQSSTVRQLLDKALVSIYIRPHYSRIIIKVLTGPSIRERPNAAPSPTALDSLNISRSGSHNYNRDPVAKLCESSKKGTGFITYALHVRRGREKRQSAELPLQLRGRPLIKFSSWYHEHR